MPPIRQDMVGPLYLFKQFILYIVPLKNYKQYTTIYASTTITQIHYYTLFRDNILTKSKMRCEIMKQIDKIYSE